jgi:hypothetical protein
VVGPELGVASKLPSRVATASGWGTKKGKAVSEEMMSNLEVA